MVAGAVARTDALTMIMTTKIYGCEGSGLHGSDCTGIKGCERSGTHDCECSETCDHDCSAIHSYKVDLH